jgi:hypothetical protein
MVERSYQLLADVVLTVHVAIVAFVVGGLVLILFGNGRSWRWVNGWWFRLAHVAAIAVVVGQAWLGVICPLTTVENWFRTRARAAVYEVGFIEYWLERVLYYDAPAWVFTAAYSLFGLAVAAAWWYFPPRRSRR